MLRFWPAILLLVSVATSSPAPANTVEDPRGVAIKIQIGGHALTQDTGIVDPSVPDSSESAGDVMGSFSMLGKDGGRTPFGVCLELDGNKVLAGPGLEVVGVQTFGIATIRALGIVEVRMREPEGDPGGSFQPYALFGAGWNFHSVGSKIEWLGFPPPEGTPLSVDLDGSPALRAGIGFHSKGTRGGLSFNLEGGWKWDRGDYTMRVQGEPDRRGRFNLSGIYALLGITLRP
jgi:hypothetical protein